MKPISEYHNEDALELLANILEPASEIMADKEVTDPLLYGKGEKIHGIKLAIQNHKKACLELLAAFEGVPVETYECNLFTLPMRLLEIVNDKEVIAFFTAQQTMSSAQSFGSATETTKEEED